VTVIPELGIMKIRNSPDYYLWRAFMGYAIAGYFDKDADNRIKALWEGMARSGVDDYLINSENNPHIKFVMYEQLDLDKAKIMLAELAESLKAIPVQFKTYSFYPNKKPFLCIDIAVSFEILDLQRKIRSSCDIYAKQYNINFFEQGIWKPDCQLTIEFEREKLTNAMQYLSNTELPFEGEINRIGIIEFHPARQLISYDLMTYKK
jgi:hypothetical protein